MPCGCEIACAKPVVKAWRSVAGSNAGYENVGLLEPRIYQVGEKSPPSTTEIARAGPLRRDFGLFKNRSLRMRSPYARILYSDLSL